MSLTEPEFPIRTVNVEAFTVPTTSPESDGTFIWDSTTLVVVEITAGGIVGTGFTYADTATAALLRSTLTKAVTGKNALDTRALWIAMVYAIRGVGRPGVASMALSALDTALWDWKGKLFGKAVVDLLGAARSNIEAYGSGGFTSYSDQQMQEQLGGWAEAGIPAVKIKIGRNPGDDLRRVRLSRKIIGEKCRLFVDANGAYTRKQALQFAERFQESEVCWFEEPVSADDLDGLRMMRDRAPAGMDIAAGEYGYQTLYFRRMLEHGAVDVLQADATRCGGVTGFLAADSLTDAWQLPLSAHTSPTLHAHLGCVALRGMNVEYFHDHAVIEHRFFDGAMKPKNGMLTPDRTRPGFGWEFKRADAEQFRVQ